MVLRMKELDLTKVMEEDYPYAWPAQLASMAGISNRSLSSSRCRIPPWRFDLKNWDWLGVEFRGSFRLTSRFGILKSAGYG